MNAHGAVWCCSWRFLCVYVCVCAKEGAAQGVNIVREKDNGRKGTIPYFT